jgi:hypothetical protein
MGSALHRGVMFDERQCAAADRGSASRQVAGNKSAGKQQATSSTQQKKACATARAASAAETSNSRLMKRIGERYQRNFQPASVINEGICPGSGPGVEETPWRRFA